MLCFLFCFVLFLFLFFHFLFLWRVAVYHGCTPWDGGEDSSGCWSSFCIMVTAHEQTTNRFQKEEDRAAAFCPGWKTVKMAAAEEQQLFESALASTVKEVVKQQQPCLSHPLANYVPVLLHIDDKFYSTFLVSLSPPLQHTKVSYVFWRYCLSVWAHRLFSNSACKSSNNFWISFALHYLLSARKTLKHDSKSILNMFWVELL